MHKDRVVLEQAIGKIVLARVNGEKVGSAAHIYKTLGGNDAVAIATLEGAFGANYNEHADKGFAHVVQRLKTSYKKALADDGKTGPVGEHFKDMKLHL